MPLKDPIARKEYVREYQRKRLARLRAADPALAKWGEQRRDASRRSHHRHRVERLMKRKVYREQNRALIAAQKRAYYERNRESVLRHQRRCYQVKKVSIQRVRKDRYHSDPAFRMTYNLRNRLRMAIVRGSKSGSAVSDLGCTIPQLMAYLEDQFHDGMSWKNWGKWHIDHIRPLASFDLSDREQLLLACHYTNLQPLWAAKNIGKGARFALEPSTAYNQSAPEQEHRLFGARADSSMTNNVMEKSQHVRPLASRPT